MPHKFNRIFGPQNDFVKHKATNARAPHRCQIRYQAVEEPTLQLHGESLHHPAATLPALTGNHDPAGWPAQSQHFEAGRSARIATAEFLEIVQGILRPSFAAMLCIRRR